MSSKNPPGSGVWFQLPLIHSANTDVVRLPSCIYLCLVACPTHLSSIDQSATLYLRPARSCILRQFISYLMVVTRPRYALCSCSVLTPISLCLQFPGPQFKHLQLKYQDVWQDSPHLSTAHSLESKLVAASTCLSSCLSSTLDYQENKVGNLFHLLSPRTFTGLPFLEPHDRRLQVSAQNQIPSFLPVLAFHFQNLNLSSLCFSASSSETSRYAPSSCHY